ncbi:MAG: leucine-rich repeat domain-containing protein [Chamaesiphon sp.]|nr:leucine-rich repeat domain-containing protein [Chamaesiphon sp.]
MSKTNSFAEWCQQKDAVSAQTRKTTDLLLECAGTEDYQLADSKLSSLTELNLHYSQISDLEPLATLTKLTHLDLSNNQISDVESLAALTNLKWLDLSNNLASASHP